MTRHVAVLLGGRSSERAVSLVSGRACAAALTGAGYRVTEIDAALPIAELVARLQPAGGDGPEVVFNALHGRFGEDGTVQGLLELMGLPFTHSGLLASAIAMDKPMAKLVFATAGIPIADGRLVRMAELAAGDPLPRPFVLKPPNEGSSVGVHIVRPRDNLALIASSDLAPDYVFLAERYIPGRELTVGVVGEGAAARALTVTEIRPKPGTFYDYDAKYTLEKAADHIVPAPVDAADFAAAQEFAVTAHRVLGCRGVSRADLRYDDSRPPGARLVMLEVNTQPGMTPMSLVPEQAAAIGIGFPALCARLVEEARCGA